jgi:hypothetical protein
MLRVTLGSLLLVAACSDEPGPSSQPVGSCDGVLATVAEAGGRHVPIDTDITWSSNPPASGPHYQNWARWDREYASLDRRYWLHNVEHGGLALLYNCPDGCPDVVEALRTRVRERPVDPTCGGQVYNRMLIAADPLLPDGVKVAAVAWDVLYTDSCVDPYLELFVTQRYNRAPEDLCAEGIELGGTFIAP